MDQNTFAQYANIFIPLGVSVLAAIGTFFVYKQKVDRLEKDVTEVKKDIRDVRDKAIACETSLRERGPLGKASSPVKLTERGEKVLLESGGKKFIDDNFERLLKAVDASDPKTAYDVQELSRKVIDGMKDSEEFIPFKKYLFAEGLSFDDLAFTLGIYLRDKILENKKWDVLDVDKSDPSLKA